MPAEAHRLTRPLGRRDRRMLALLACAALVGTPGAVLLSRHGTRDGASTRCVEMTRAAITRSAIPASQPARPPVMIAATPTKPNAPILIQTLAIGRSIRSRSGVIAERSPRRLPSG